MIVYRYFMVRCSWYQQIDITTVWYSIVGSNVQNTTLV